MKPFLQVLLAMAAIACLNLSPASGQTNGPALTDPSRAGRCVQLAMRRQDPRMSPMLPLVEDAAYRFDLPIVFEAVADCRRALAADPTSPPLIVATFLASDALTLLAFGKDFPPNDEVAVTIARLTAGAMKGNKTLQRIFGFYLGSAHEYGIGTKVDLVEAARWYRFAASESDEISSRELTRLEQRGTQLDGTAAHYPAQLKP